MHVTKYVCTFMKSESTTCEQHPGQVAFACRLIPLQFLQHFDIYYLQKGGAFILLLVDEPFCTLYRACSKKKSQKFPLLTQITPLYVEEKQVIKKIKNKKSSLLVLMVLMQKQTVLSV